MSAGYVEVPRLELEYIRDLCYPSDERGRVPADAPRYEILPFVKLWLASEESQP